MTEIIPVLLLRPLGAIIFRQSQPEFRATAAIWLRVNAHSCRRARIRVSRPRHTNIPRMLHAIGRLPAAFVSCLLPCSNSTISGRTFRQCWKTSDPLPAFGRPFRPSWLMPDETCLVVRHRSALRLPVPGVWKTRLGRVSQWLRSGATRPQQTWLQGSRNAASGRRGTSLSLCQAVRSDRMAYRSQRGASP